MSTLWDSDSMGDFGFSLKLGFDADDLLANREGKLSKRQKRKLRNRLIQTPIIMIMIDLSLWIFFPMMITYIDSKSFITFFFIVVFSGLFIAAWGLDMLDLYRAKAYSVEGELSHVDRVYQSHRTHTTLYFVYINPIKFHVSDDIQSAFEDKQPYRIYYLSLSKAILSAERVHHAADLPA